MATARYLLTLPLLATASTAAMPATTCSLPSTPTTTVGSRDVWMIDNGLLFRSPILKVDADGAPNSYRVDGNGLSYTCDGVVAVENGVRITTDHPDWQQKCRAAWQEANRTGDYSKVDIFGFLKDDRGRPVVQGKDDPLPGAAYITTTYVNIPGTPDRVQRRYVDATSVPYLVIPERIRATQKVPDGALAVIYRPKTGKYAFAVFGDTGGKLDEASVRLHQDLGGSPYANAGGTTRAKNNIEDPVVGVIFPGVVSAPRADADAWREDIASKGAAALAAWGGIDRLKLCRP